MLLDIKVFSKSGLILNFGNSQKSQGFNFHELGGQSIFVTDFSASISQTHNASFTRALSWLIKHLPE